MGRAGWVVAAGAIGVAALAVAAIILLNGGSGSKSTAGGAYQRDLRKALSPLIAANQTLSGSLTALDGSPTSIRAAKISASQALGALSAAHGAVAVVTTPNSQASLAAQVQQGLTTENGYLQAVSATLETPSGASAGQLQTLATGAQSALDQLASVTSGASSSISGTGNLVSWAQSASGAAHAQQGAHRESSSTRSATSAQQSTTTIVQQTASAATPAGSPQGLTSCDQNISVNSATTCPFANNVFAQYASAVQQSGGPISTDVTATSPATGATYVDNCQFNSSTQIVLCSHGSDLIQFPEWSAAVYTG